MKEGLMLSSGHALLQPCHKDGGKYLNNSAKKIKGHISS